MILRNQKINLSIIFLITALTFGNIFLNDFINDDFDYIVDWPLIQNLMNVPRFFINYVTPDGQEGIYSPLRTLAFALNYQLWGLQPWGWHLFSLLVHCAGILFIYKLTQLLTENPIISFGTALFFAVHPVHTESVSSMTGSVDTLGIVFFLVSFYYYIRAVGYDGMFVIDGGSGNTGGTNRPVPAASSGILLLRNHKQYYLSLTFAFLAVFTHELMIMLPILFFFYECFNREPLSKTRIRTVFLRLIPFFGIVFVYVLAKGMVLGAVSRGRYLFDSFYLSLLVVIKAWVKYVSISLIPWTLTHNHVISPGIFSFEEGDFDKQAALNQSIADPQTLFSLIIILIIIAIAVYCVRRKPMITFCIGWFFVCLLPASQIIPSSVYFAERYLYLGSWTFCLLLTYCLYSIYHARRTQKFRWVSDILAVSILFFYSTRTFVRNLDLRNEVTLYEAAVRANPHSAFMHNNLAIVYLGNGEEEKALEHFNKAIALKPEQAHFYFSREEVFAGRRDFPNAIQTLQKATELNPEFAEAYFNLAGLYAHIGEEEKALVNLDKAIEAFKKQGRIFEAGEYARTLYGYMAASKQIIKKEVNPEDLKDLFR